MNATLSNYLQEVIGLTEKYQQEMQMPDCDAAVVCEELMDKSFKRMLSHIVQCDFTLTSGIPVTSGTIRYSTDDVNFIINVETMMFSVVCDVEADFVLVQNEIASNEQLCTILKRLVAIVDGTEQGDLFDYASVKVLYLTTLYAVGKDKCDEFQAIITQQQELPAPTSTPIPQEDIHGAE